MRPSAQYSFPSVSYTGMMRSLLIRVIAIGALVTGLGGCDVLGTVLDIVLATEPTAEIRFLDGNETIELGESAAFRVGADVRRGYRLKWITVKVNEASRSAILDLVTDREPEPTHPPLVLAPATASPTPDVRPLTSFASEHASFKPESVGRYRIVARVDLRDRWTATRDLEVVPPRPKH